MDKKLYVAPELTELGEIEAITQAEGLDGNDDQFYFFSWGTDPTSG